MNVEITNNSKEVSGAIHQVGQAIGGHWGFLQTWESLQQGHWHRTVAVLYPGRFLRALRAFCKWESLAQQDHGGTGMRERFAASPQSALASPTGGWSFYWELSKTDTFSYTGTQELVQ